MKISCDVILDLIPLVKDGVASEGSSLIVNEHIKKCETCQAEFEESYKIELKQPSIKDEKIISAIKRSIFISQIIILILGGIVGIIITDTVGTFYNLIIMPIIGALSFLVLKRKWYWASFAIFIITYLWQTTMFIISDGFSLLTLSSGLYFSVIYTILIGLGVIIAKLLKFTFKKEG